VLYIRPRSRITLDFALPPSLPSLLPSIHLCTYLHGAPKAAHPGKNDDFRGIDLLRAVERKREGEFTDI